jgi:hypothetical protein
MAYASFVSLITQQPGHWGASAPQTYFLTKLRSYQQDQGLALKSLDLVPRLLDKLHRRC